MEPMRVSATSHDGHNSGSKSVAAACGAEQAIMVA